MAGDCLFGQTPCRYFTIPGLMNSPSIRPVTVYTVPTAAAVWWRFSALPRTGRRPMR